LGHVFLAQTRVTRNGRRGFEPRPQAERLWCFAFLFWVVGCGADRWPPAFVSLRTAGAIIERARRLYNALISDISPPTKLGRFKTGAGEGIRTLDPNLGKKLLQIPQSFFFYAKVRKSKHLLTSAYDNLS